MFEALSEPIESMDAAPPWRRFAQSAWKFARKNGPAWCCSAALHACVMLILAAVILPQIVGAQKDFETISSFTQANEEPALMRIPMAVSSESAPLSMSAVPSPSPLPLPSPKLTDPSVEMAMVGPEPSPAVDFTGAAGVPKDSEAAPPPAARVVGGSRKPGRTAPLVGDDDGKGLRLTSSDSVEGAADQIISDLRGKMETKDTLVVWLLDGSISMQRDLDLLASRLEPFIRQSEANRSERLLMHAVVAFGLKPQELVAPTPKSHEVLTAIRNVPIDPSGMENTLIAVEEAIDRYLRRVPKNRAKNIQFVVWTDESGEDILRLENTIALCQKNKVSVSVVGPSAVLGSARGYHSYVAPENGLLYYLPVTRGPDTAFPEKPRLPYWHRTVPEHWKESERGPWQGNLQLWQGGSDLESMLSGFGPYALIRLTRETGGSYTIFDRPLDRPPFKLENLRQYLPDYRAAQQVATSISEVPLRMTVIAAVEATYARGVNLAPPAFSFGSGLLSPMEFRTSFPPDLLKQQQRLAGQAVFVERALALFGPEGMEAEYEVERLPRWKAWYDLTRGRLLAWSVRLREYDAALRIMSSPRFLGTDTNIVTLIPSPVLLSGKETELRAQEAARLLNRCAKQNAGTPWKYLAERELQDALGFDARQQYLKLRPIFGGTIAPSRAPSLPNL